MEQAQDRSVLGRSASSARIRHIGYLIYLLLLLAMICYLCTYYEGEELKGYFKDDNIVENLQLFNILVAAIIALWIASTLFFEKEKLAWPVLCVGFGLLWATNRELDQFWENHNLEGVYRFFQYLFGIGGAAVLLLRFRICWREYKKWATSLPMVLFYCAIALWIIAEAGGGVLDEVLLNHMVKDKARAVKRVFEESVEMFTTPLLVFAAIELLLIVRFRRSEKSRESTPSS